MSTTRYWVIVASKNHVRHGVQAGVAQANHGKAAPLKRMSVGDRILYYSPKVEFGGDEQCQSFTAIGTVSGDKIYSFDMGDGFIPYRRDVEYQDCAEVPIQLLLPALTFIENKSRWGYIFRFGFFEIPQVDFDLISAQMLGGKGAADGGF